MAVFPAAGVEFNTDRIRASSYDPIEFRQPVGALARIRAPRTGDLIKIPNDQLAGVHSV